MSPPAREQDVSNFRTPGHGPESARLTTARGHRPARREIQSGLRGQRPPGSRRGAARSQTPSVIICRRCRSAVGRGKWQAQARRCPEHTECFRNEDFVLSAAKVHAFQPLAGATRLLRCCGSPRSGHGSRGPLSGRTMQPARSPKSSGMPGTARRRTGGPSMYADATRGQARIQAGDFSALRPAHRFMVGGSLAGLEQQHG